MATIPGVFDGELIRTSWGDAVADELNGNTVKKTGDHVMTGALTVGGQIVANDQVFISDATPVSIGHATRKDYVDSTTVSVTGDTMTGALQLGGAPFTQAGTVIYGASGDGRIRNTVLDSGVGANLILNRGSTADATNQQFIGFSRTGSGTAIGQIRMASSSSVAYDTTSDPRLKERTGDVADAADLIRQLGAKAYRGRWIADAGGGEEWVFLNSTDVEPVAPFAVAGEADAVDADGNIVPQQLDHAALVPLLCAALAQALDRIAALEAG